MSIQSYIDVHGKTVEIHRATKTVDSSGFPKWTYAVKHRNQRAAFVPSATTEVERGGRMLSVRSVTMSFAAGTDVLIDDRVVLKNADGTTDTFDIKERRDVGQFGPDHAMSRILCVAEEPA